MTVSILRDDFELIRADFPVLARVFHGNPLVYLDNAATTQKPRSVIDRLTQFYSQEYGTIHRGVYGLSQRATEMYDETRAVVRQFLNAESVSEIVFTKGTTESINLVAHSYGKAFLGPGHEILISGMEHHANLVPWQEVCKATGAVLKVIPVQDDGSLLLEDVDALISQKTKIVALVHVSNALGTVNPVKEIIACAHAVGAVVLVDGAQAVSHLAVDVQDLDCDFYVFSSHKLYGPTGVGVLYGKRALLERMGPYQTGGDMVETVTFEKTTFASVPARFEAGTPQIAEVIAFAEAIRYVESIGFDLIQDQEGHLLAYATSRIQTLPGVRVIGQAQNKASVLSFVMDGIHPHDIGTILDEAGIAIRAGHHCAQPVMKRFGVPATCRASFAFYNTLQEVDLLVAGLAKCQELLG
jgi:cysteine desulfurase/selenocysteine lyase